MSQQSVWEKYPALKKIPTDRFPRHIFIIPDGNGRWAKARGKFVTEGHKKGFEAAEKLLDDLSEVPQIKAVTLWGFAADNWKRSKKEVDGLMRIFSFLAKKTIKKIQNRNGRFIFLGRRDRIPKTLLQQFIDGVESTKNNTGQIVAIAIDFGGEDQNLRSLQAAQVYKVNITEEILWDLRDGHGIIKAADLLIRTSGEKRTSDVGWLNGISTELYFTDKLFPDITTQDIVDAIVDFSKRERRFGGRNETTRKTT